LVPVPILALSRLQVHAKMLTSQSSALSDQ